MAVVFTFGAVLPSSAHTTFNSLTSNYLTMHRGFYRAEANSQNTHPMCVRRGQYVRVRINGDTDLDLFVYDAQGRLVGQDLSLDDKVVLFRFRVTFAAPRATL